MKSLILFWILPILGLAASRGAAQSDLAGVLKALNATKSVNAHDEHKSFALLFDAYLKLSKPPFPIGESFNHMTIHAAHADWAQISGWAESNPAMAEAILAGQDRAIFGLPYGVESVKSEYREANLVADIGHAGSLHDNRFPYLDAIDVIAAYVTAECYRLCEAGNTKAALDLAMASITIFRQCCDREFMDEQFYCITLLTEAMANLCDLVYIYLDKCDWEQLRDLAVQRLAFIRPDRNRLFMAEGDRVVAEAIIRSVFDSQGPDRERFASTFAAIQSREAPLTRFGAARRWRMVAEIHDSLESSLARLTLVYDDWWRRWRVEEYDPILAIPTFFEKSNPIRYAAVIYAMQNIADLFPLRNSLIAATNGTQMALGAAAYRLRLGTYARETLQTYSQYTRKRSDRDPWDKVFGKFQYFIADGTEAMDTPYGRVTLPAGVAVLYSVGLDHEDGRARLHSDDAKLGDMVIWPPVKPLQRAAGLRD